MGFLYIANKSTTTRKSSIRPHLKSTRGPFTAAGFPIWSPPAAASLVFRFLFFASARRHKLEEKCRPQCAEVDGHSGHRSSQHNVFASLTDGL